jgi:pilus assembly protein CpaB
MTRRIVAITIAIALAALGAAGGLFLILTADKRAQDRLTDGVTVAVASQNLSVGMSGAKLRQNKLVTYERVARALVPDDAVTDFDTGAYDTQVLTSNVVDGTMLLKGNFGTHGSDAGGLPLPDGMVAVTVQTGSPQQVAGYVHVGSEVVIFLTYTVVNQDGTKTNEQRTRVLLPKVQILAIGGPNSSNNNQNNSLLVTVAVSPKDAQYLIEGLSHGTLYLGLLTDSANVSNLPGVSNEDGTRNVSPLFP